MWLKNLIFSRDLLNLRFIDLVWPLTVKLLLLLFDLIVAYKINFLFQFLFVTLLSTNREWEWNQYYKTSLINFIDHQACITSASVNFMLHLYCVMLELILWKYVNKSLSTCFIVSTSCHGFFCRREIPTFFCQRR